MLEEKDIKLNHVYSAKRESVVTFGGAYNDRMVIHISSTRQQVQYDSPTVKNGRRYPTVSMEKFLRWAKADVTDQTPKGDWRAEPARSAPPSGGGEA